MLKYIDVLFLGLRFFKMWMAVAGFPRLLLEVAAKN